MIIYRCVNGPLHDQYLTPQQIIETGENWWVYEFEPRRPLEMIGRRLTMTERRERRKQEKMGWPPNALA